MQSGRSRSNRQQRFVGARSSNVRYANTRRSPNAARWISTIYRMPLSQRPLRGAAAGWGGRYPGGRGRPYRARPCPAARGANLPARPGAPRGGGLECGGTTPSGWRGAQGKHVGLKPSQSGASGAASAGNQSADVSAHSKPGTPALPIVHRRSDSVSHGFNPPNSRATPRLPEGGEDISQVQGRARQGGPRPLESWTFFDTRALTGREDHAERPIALKPSTKVRQRAFIERAVRKHTAFAKRGPMRDPAARAAAECSPDRKVRVRRGSVRPSSAGATGKELTFGGIR